MPASAVVRRLVERLQLHGEEFLLDSDREQGFAEASKDVVHEDALRIEGEGTSPDYCCRIGGTRKS